MPGFLDLGLMDRLDTSYYDRTICFPTLATLPGHEGSSKSHKNAFLNDPKCQIRGFLDLGLMDRLDTAYYDRT